MTASAEHRDRVLQAIADFQRGQGRRASAHKAPRMAWAKQGEKLLWDCETDGIRQTPNQGARP